MKDGPNTALHPTDALAIVLMVTGGVIGTVLVIQFIRICRDRGCCCRKSRGAQGRTFGTMNAGIANPGVGGQVVVNAGAPGTYPAYGQQQPMAMGTTQAVGGYNAPQSMGAYPVTLSIGGYNAPQPMSGYNAPQPMRTAPEPRDDEKWQQAPPAYSTLRCNAPQPIATAPEPRDDKKWPQAPPAYTG